MALLAGLAAGVPAVARAATPLAGRYDAYFATPFDHAPGLVRIQPPLPPGVLPLPYVETISERVAAKRFQDRARIRRTLGGYAPDTGFEDVDDDGLVTEADLEALDDLITAHLRSLAPTLTDDELGVPRPLDPSSSDDPVRFQESIDAVEAELHLCIALGCDDDGDAVDDFDDLCPGEPDPEQLDADGDGFGAACDDDDDATGVSDALEDCLGAGLSPENGIAEACLDNLDELAATLYAVKEDFAGRGVPIPPEADTIEADIETAVRLIESGNPTLAAPVLAAALEEARRLEALGAEAGRAAYLVVLLTYMTQGLAPGTQGDIFAGRLCARGGVALDNNAVVTGPGAASGVVAGGSLTVGNNARLEGTAVVGCAAEIRNNAVVTGDLFAGGAVTLANNATVQGSIAAIPCDACGMGAVSAACDGRFDVDGLRQVGESLLTATIEALASTLPSGRLDADGNLRLENNDAALLPPGLWAFRSVALSNNVRLGVTSGHAILIVLDALTVQNNVALGTTGAGELAIAFTGGASVALSNNTLAKLWLFAPLSELTMLSNNVVYEGGLDVGALRMANNNQVTLAAPGMAVDVPALCGF